MKTSISNNIYRKHVVAVFTISVIFAIFAGLYNFPLHKAIATALVSSILGYCNSLLYNTANKDMTKLQLVQNCFARVVTRSPRFSRSVLLLKSLHYRIIVKICTIAYQALSSTQPAYLNSMQDIPDSYAQPVVTPLHSSGENESWNLSFLGCRTNRTEFASCQC